MNKLIPLLALIAAPAAAQEAQVYFASSAWPVETAGRTCSMSHAANDGSDALTIAYDAASGEVALTAETDSAAPSLPASGTVQFAIVFLQNGRTAYDDQWGSRTFSYRREGTTARFTTRFAGEPNVRQIFADLGASHDVGFLQQRQAVMSTNLELADASLRKLQECARRAIAAN
ncbi:MAG: hypothetical protein ABIT16_03975 [Croceibacterium sp.]